MKWKRSLSNILVLSFFFGLLIPTAHASLTLTIQGKVESMDENFVIIRKEATLIKVPRRSIQSNNLRPGQLVTSLIDSNAVVETWAAKKTKSEK